MGFKYVMLQVDLGLHSRKMIPIIFPDFMIHDEVAKSFKSILSSVHKMDATVFSAGEITFEDPICEGGSSTLKIDSDDDDERTIRMYNYFHGITDK